MNATTLQNITRKRKINLNSFRRLLILMLILFSGAQLLATNGKWDAQWIGPTNSTTDYGTFYFRKTVEFSEAPKSFVIHVSGDNRYRLFVNGTEICFGPAKSDVAHWNYETVDIASSLKNGTNTLTALVWNDGKFRPLAQMSHRTAFILQGESTAESEVNTNSTWKILKSHAYQAIPITVEMVKGYYASIPGERIDGNKLPWGWKMENYDDTAWDSAFEIGRADLKFNPWTGDWIPRWMLVPRKIPLMETHQQRIEKVLISEGIIVPEGFPKQAINLKIPPHTKVRLLLDQSFLTTAFPVLKMSGGKETEITIRYAESLFEKNSSSKGNRNEFEGKEMFGFEDKIILDGGLNRTYETKYWRAYRYLELTIKTGATEMNFHDIYGIYTSYPFQLNSKFESSDKELAELLTIGWRTARLCAHENYMDTPYYEQLQYIGDTRIQGMVSIYNSGDARLLKQAIEQIDHSRIPEGLTYSRYPSASIQLIPPFSLWWIGMLNDYMMYVPDSSFVKETIPGMRSVLAFFSTFQNEQGSLQNLPWWNFMDWAPEWVWGVPPLGNDGSSALFDLLLLKAYQWGENIETVTGNSGMANEYKMKAQLLQKTIKSKYWNTQKKLFSDTNEGTHFSQQANALAILTNTVKGQGATDLLNRILNDSSLVKCTSYFQYYLNGVLAQSGLGDRYIDQLEEWRQQKELGLSTWREAPEPSRSDCHAWSASPNIELYRTVLGIRSNAPGFSEVLIAPHPADLKQVSGEIPHPLGKIKVEIDQQPEGKTNIRIQLPKKLKGQLEWKGKRFDLQNKKEYLFTF